MVTDKASFRDWLEWEYRVGAGGVTNGFSPLVQKERKGGGSQKSHLGKALPDTPALARRNKGVHSSLEIIMFTYD